MIISEQKSIFADTVSWSLYSFIGLGMLLPVVSWQKVHAQGNAGTTTSELLGKMVAGWQQLEQMDDEVRSCRVRYTLVTSKGERTQVDARVGVGKRCQYFASDRLVFALSPRYGFLLQRADPAQSSWKLVTFLDANQVNDPRLRDVEYHPLKGISQCFRPLSAYGIGGVRLAKIAEISDIHIDKVEMGEEGVLIIACTLRNKRSTSQAQTHIWMVVDPEALYCPIEIKRMSTLQPTQRIEEKRVLISKHPIRCGSYSYRLLENEHIENEVTLTFDDYTNHSPSDEELSMSHYGLPEPVGVVWERRTPVYVWLLVAAGVLLTLAVFFRWLSRRLRRGMSEG